MRFLLISCFAATAVAASPAQAGEVFGGIAAHAVDTPLTLGGRGEDGVDVQLGYRWNRLGRTGFEPYAFMSANTSGNTHFAAAGISYRFGRQLYVRPGVGIAVHTGSAANFENPGNNKIEFGSRVLFEPELGVGYQVNDRLSVEANWVHLSHAQIFGKQNPGIDNIGVRLNWKL